MKALTWILAIAAGTTIWTACEPANAKYIDLATGQEVVLERDEEKGEMINVTTGEPVKLYVNSKSKDTIYGPSGKIVNNEIVRLDNMYVYSGDEEYKLKLEKNGDFEEKYGDEYKVKSDADGDYKEKRGDDNKVKYNREGSYKRKHGEDYKVKRGDNGSYKIKRGDSYKKEVEEDGDIKIKQGNVKIEIDGETGERKVEVDD
ncbi:MAG: hypothetical protein K0R82_2176 [Flavipsychrobacter sp.]|jgi:hypothetical protein|nr:hypothetical protein [Flavipsychrobacter sp.]